MSCFRHPGREAYRKCTRCGRPACTECLVQAQVGSHCVECARQSRPDVRTRARYWSARQPTLVTYALMALNLLVFAWVGIQDPDSLTSRNLTEGQVELGLIESATFRGEPIGLDAGEWYRLVTSGFLHFGIIHIAFNMLLLFQLGQLLEPAIGRIRFALLYFSALLAGSAGALLLQPNELVGGASGAVFGLMGAAFVGLRHRGVNPLTTGIGTVLVLNLLITFTLPGIAIGGHIGGLIGGGLAGWVVLAPSYKGVPRWATYAAPVAVIVISVIISVAVTKS
jgi:membrane associated rhomboid family serine protease